MKELKLYFKYINMHFRSGLQYKGWPLMVLQCFIVVITDPLGFIFMFYRFGNVGAWSVERIMLMYAVAVTSYGLAESFCRGFDYFPWKMIRSGAFDRLLLRPKSLFVQVAGSFFHIHRLSRVFGGSLAIVWSLWKQGIHMDLLKFFILFLALIGGTLTYTGVFVFSSGLAFFTIKGLDWIYIFSNVSYQVTRCPIEYMPKFLKGVFTFFMPLLIISYYPASYICGWGEPFIKAAFALPAGFAFFTFSIFIWRVGVRHYKSTGS